MLYVLYVLYLLYLLYVLHVVLSWARETCLAISAWMVWRPCAQCTGRTRHGRQCSISTASQLVDDFGRQIADPLLRGGSHCRFHLDFFAVSPATVPADDVLVVFFDLETTGTSVAKMRSALCLDSCVLYYMFFVLLRKAWM